MPRPANSASHLLHVLAALCLATPAGAQSLPKPSRGPLPASPSAPSQRPFGTGDVEEELGGRFFTSSAPFLGAPGVHHFVFNGTGTAWQEPFLLGVPRVPLSPAPLLVLFHSYSVSEWDCFKNTGLMKRAMDRGWYVVAPRGAHEFNFGIPYAQQNIEFVLDWLMGAVDIDESRVYGVGFSMGGGGATNYAARHLDPAHAMFAALVNHTGTVSVSHVYYNSNPTGMAIFENPLMFGGSPAAVPFAYQRSSVIHLSHPDLTIDPTSDLARNIKHVPIRHWSAIFDPLTYLLLETNAVHNWQATQGANTARVEVISSEHRWRTLNEPQVLDFLAAHTLQVPAQGTHRLLADRDARFLHFSVLQDVPDVFTPFRWNFDPNLNRIVIDQTRNLKRITVHTGSIGLDTSIELNLITSTLDGTPDEIGFDGYAQIPSDVRRGGISTPNWSFDAGTGCVVLYESNGAGYPQWTIVP